MADIANRYTDNVPGKFYVDNQCIDCDLCRETAPANFTRKENYEKIRFDSRDAGDVYGLRPERFGRHELGSG